ncbi:MAG: hypothetical protein CL675_12315 [Bdellovibrionaceae bacterium]|nr:hypothetical protein [Pseudobdellovibrionaceae bacterium]
MSYPILATVFFVSVLLLVALLVVRLMSPPTWRRNRRRLLNAYSLWFMPYVAFIVFFTGPTGADIYPSPNGSPYRLPWKKGERRFVAQGNRSFTSHRGAHLYAWDFIMPTSTEVLASRSGVVIRVEDGEQGIGIESNLIVIQHSDGTKAGYAHIQQASATVEVGDYVHQGMPIGLSGMVGQTLFPHLHFYVVDETELNPVPISFEDVDDGVPRALRSYVSSNNRLDVKFNVVEFDVGSSRLRGELFKPQGPGPFPTILFNHGSAPGMLNSQASVNMAPFFLKKGWAFFMPYRRGQGLSEAEGPYIMDTIKSAIQKSGMEKGVQVLIEQHKNELFEDQAAAYSWLLKQDFVDSSRVATVGNSFGGIQVLIGMARLNYCAGVNAGGGAKSWKQAISLQYELIKTSKAINRPIFFFQAQNDYDLSPTRLLSGVMRRAGKSVEAKIYPAFGSTPREGHQFPYRGVSQWFGDVSKFLDRHCGKSAPY